MLFGFGLLLSKKKDMSTVSFLLTTALVFATAAVSAQSSLDTYLSNYTYESRKEMKVSSEEIIDLLQNDEAVLVDIRFEEEQAAWQMNFSLKIPLPDLPRRYTELPTNKLIVTACPHKDRAIMAMMYLKSKGYKAAYLKDGLLGLTEYLRGDNAYNFIENFKE